jgi:O-acetyl-ADP-ribose deacetylase (regulator of RNase III)
MGWQVQERLQKQIKEKHNGELLVGQAILIETGFSGIPYLISAPTMRVPMILKDAVNVYLASKAIFILLKHKIQKTEHELKEECLFIVSSDGTWENTSR